MGYTTKELHSEILKILSYIDSVLTENDLHYSLAYGTVLGAVRENGFIPWDRDADVYIKLPERDKVREALKRNLPDEFQYIDASVNNVNCFDNLRSKKYGEFAQVDIYSLIGEPDVTKWSDTKVKRRLLGNKVLVKLTCAKYGDYHKLHKAYKVLPFLLIKGILHFIPDRLIRLFIRKKEEAIPYDQALYCKALVGYTKRGEYLRKEVFENVTRHEFCGKQFNIPADYDTYLKARYGSDYMTPKQKNW